MWRKTVHFVAKKCVLLMAGKCVLYLTIYSSQAYVSKNKNGHENSRFSALLGIILQSNELCEIISTAFMY